MSKSTNTVTTPSQLSFDLEIVVEAEIDGVGMGVLGDGTPFLTLRGLARMCGIDHTTLVKLTSEWGDTSTKAREQKIRDLIKAQGFDDTVFFTPSKRTEQFITRFRLTSVWRHLSIMRSKAHLPTLMLSRAFVLWPRRAFLILSTPKWAIIQTAR